MPAFVYEVRIPFGDCDPAGILYYPRYFDLFHRTMEAWFDGPVGVPYASFIRDHGYGVPTVHAEADYLHPTAFGEIVTVALSVDGWGTSSIRFAYVLRGPDGVERVRGRVVCVVMDLDPSRETFRTAVPIPDFLVQQFPNFAAEAAP
jgi:4-hydroxybenzoyl-CoA thioesterase